MSARPHSYSGVALVCPVTVPYVRRSERDAAWFIGRCLAQMLDTAGVDKADIDGLSVASFTLAPDSAVSTSTGLTVSGAP